MRGTKEFYDLMDNFEKAAKNHTAIPSLRLDREPRDSAGYERGYFYQDGTTNQLFHAYMCGYQFGRLTTSH